MARGGEIVTKDELLERFWPDVNVTENTLTRAIADIRKAIGDDAARAAIPADRFAAWLSLRRRQRATIRSRQAIPFEEWVKGRLALDSLDAAKFDDAVRAFERTAAELPRMPRRMPGSPTATCCNSSRRDSANAPDRELLDARDASGAAGTTLDASLGEGWAVLGLPAVRGGQDREARRQRAGPPRSNLRTGAIIIGLPTAPGVKSVCARSIARWP